MLAETAFAGAGALNANFPRFCNNSGLSGIDNIADITAGAGIANIADVRTHRGDRQ